MRYGCKIFYYAHTKRDMVAILYKQTHNMRYGCYIIYTNTKCDMVAILNHQTQNAIWLLY